jgi:hypothetical protein
MLLALLQVYERAVANLPPGNDKRFWRRYIYLWIKYALFEELDTGEPERAREVYRYVPQYHIQSAAADPIPLFICWAKQPDARQPPRGLPDSLTACLTCVTDDCHTVRSVGSSRPGRARDVYTCSTMSVEL